MLGVSNRPTVPQSVSVGAGLPPVPSRLVKQIESGAFVEMTELLPERLGSVDDAKAEETSSFHTGMAPVLCSLCFSVVLKKT